MKHRLIVLLAVLSVFALAAQNADTLEENYLQDAQIKKQIQMEVLRQQAGSEDLEQKERSLKGIDSILNNPDYILGPGDREEIAEVLNDLALLGTGIISFRGVESLKSVTEIRKESARLLGNLGKNEAAVILINMLRNDKSALVLGQCAVSSAQVIPTMDLEKMPRGDSQIVQILADTMKSQMIRDDEGHFALGYLDAILTISKYKPSLLNNSAVIGELNNITLSSSGYNRLVRDRAKEVMEEIQSF